MSDLVNGGTVITTPTAPSTRVTVQGQSGTVATSPGRQGPPGAGVNLAGAVATYADLPTTLGPSDNGKAYVVNADGKLYVWDGTAFPSDGNGSPFKGDQGDPGVGISNISLVGDDVLRFSKTDASNKDITIPAITAANTSATNAAASASAASASATSASGSASSATGSASAASGSAAAASTSASAASGSASDASTSASAAATSASDAADSATAASTAQAAAEAAQSSAETSESNAEGSATTASSAKDTAVSAKNDAASSATAAASSASDAADSAAAAAQSAEDAASVVNDGVPNASATIKGGIMIPGGVDGEVGGTWDHPTVAGWDNKADLVSGKIPSSQLPSVALTSTQVVVDTAARLAVTAETGDLVVQTGNPGRGTYILSGDDPTDENSWTMLVFDQSVSSVNGYTGIVVLGKGDVGLGNVNNTSDAGKPISTATQDALDSKADAVHTHNASDITAGTLAYARLPIGVTASTVAAGDDSRIVNAVPNTRAVSAGTGLSGGGVLSADRTLSVSFGTTSTTACVGNDTRLSDTRTPTDGTVTNAKVASAAAIALSKLAAGYVQGSVNGTATTLTVWTGTATQYAAIVTKDSNTVYVVTA